MTSNNQSFEDTLKNCLITLANSAGDLALRYQQEGKIEAEWKSDGTPVTDADKEADRIIKQGLESNFPDIPVISEETSEILTPAGDQEWRKCFIVDPIDGTSGYLSGKDEYTINIAFVEKGLPKAGVIFAPALKRLFLTVRSGELIELDDGQTKFHTVTPRQEGLPRAVASRSRHSQKQISDYLAKMGIDHHQTMSSSLKFGLLAVGKFDLYPRFGPTMEWDTAAGHAILQSVGGDVFEMGTGQPLRYGKPSLQNPNFVAKVQGVKLWGHV